MPRYLELPEEKTLAVADGLLGFSQPKMVV